jgi:hypothetical protein
MMLNIVRVNPHAVALRTGCIAAIMAVTWSTGARGQGLRGLVGDLSREAAKIADDVPVRSVDDIVEQAGRSRALRESIEAEMRIVRDVPQATRRTEAILKLIRDSSAIDPVIMRRIGELDGPAQEAALAIARGGSGIATAVPDVAARSRMVKAGGPELLAAVGAREARAAQDVALQAYRVQQAIEAGTLASKAGRAVSVADFGRAVARHGEATITFWDRYVRPHWGKWLTGGALAAYLVAPETFQDAGGNLTDAGFRRLTELVGAVAAGAIRGAGRGAGDAAESIWTAILETFFTGPNRIYSTIGVVFIGMALLLRFRRIRHWVGRPFRWLNQTPAEDDHDAGREQR